MQVGIKRRKPNSPKRGLDRFPQESSSSNETSSIEARIKRIEDQLNLAQSTGISNSDVSSGQGLELNPTDSGIQSNFASTAPEAVMYTTPKAHTHRLPDRKNILPVIEHYFQNANNIIPLFDQLSFMRIFSDWYTNPASRTRVQWAAIQVVIALSLRTPGSEAMSIPPRSTKMANAYLDNAKAVIPELVTRDEDLLGLQVLLGIVFLLQYSSDQKPASVVIVSAMRLVHRLELHSSVSTQPWSSDEVTQRSRVFWIAYALDKEISLRVKTPSIQSDSDIDLPLPPASPVDGVGLIWTLDGRNMMNLFRLRVELAHIQGIIYDLLYSNRAAQIDELERGRRVAQVQAKLEKWCERVPAVFRIDYVSSNVGPTELVQITKMHNGYLLSKATAHGFYSRDADWIKGTGSPSSITMDDLVVTQYQFGAARGNTNQSPPSPSGWQELVQISRGYMKLFHTANQVGDLIWQCSCGHASALLILLANMFLSPSHFHWEVDRHLSNKSMELVVEILKTTQDKAFVAISKLVKDLSRMANEAVETHRTKENNTLEDLTFYLDADEELLLGGQDWNFDMPENQMTVI